MAKAKAKAKAKATQTGEIAITSSVGGTRQTLDPLREQLLAIACKEVASTTHCGFQTPWVVGDRLGADYDLLAGAGVGSPWMTFRYKGRDYCINVKDILDALFLFADETAV